MLAAAAEDGCRDRGGEEEDEGKERQRRPALSFSFQYNLCLAGEAVAAVAPAPAALLFSKESDSDAGQSASEKDELSDDGERHERTASDGERLRIGMSARTDAPTATRLFVWSDRDDRVVAKKERAGEQRGLERGPGLHHRHTNRNCMDT